MAIPTKHDLVVQLRIFATGIAKASSHLRTTVPRENREESDALEALTEDVAVMVIRLNDGEPGPADITDAQSLVDLADRAATISRRIMNSSIAIMLGPDIEGLRHFVFRYQAMQGTDGYRFRPE